MAFEGSLSHWRKGKRQRSAHPSRHVAGLLAMLAEEWKAPSKVSA
jgi:hypothetical protein